MQLCRIAIHAKSACAHQLIFAVSTTQESDRKHSRTTRCEQVPDGVTDDVTLIN
jgi:hypothetical protein